MVKGAEVKEKPRKLSAREQDIMQCNTLLQIASGLKAEFTTAMNKWWDKKIAGMQQIITELGMVSDEEYIKRAKMIQERLNAMQQGASTENNGQKLPKESK